MNEEVCEHTAITRDSSVVNKGETGQEIVLLEDKDCM